MRYVLRKNAIYFRFRVKIIVKLMITFIFTVEDDVGVGFSHLKIIKHFLFIFMIKSLPIKFKNET